MPRSAITRFLVVLVLAVAGGVAAFTWWTTRTSGPTPAAVGETPPVTQDSTPPVVDAAADIALYDRRCGTCHQPDDLVPWIRAAGGPEAQRQALIELLADHGSATPDESVRLADYLVRVAGR